MNQTKSSYWSLVAGIAAAIYVAVEVFYILRQFFSGANLSFFLVIRLSNIIGVGLLGLAAFLKKSKPLPIIGFIVILVCSCRIPGADIYNCIYYAFESLLDWDIVDVLGNCFYAFICALMIAAPLVALILAVKYTGSKKVATSRAKRLFWLPTLFIGIYALRQIIVGWWFSRLSLMPLLVIYFSLMKWLAETAPETVSAPATPAQPQYATPAQPHYATPAQPQYATPTQPHYATPAQPQYATPAQPQYATPAPAAVDPVTELQRYKALADAGVITAEDYEAKKKQLLNL